MSVYPVPIVWVKIGYRFVTASALIGAVLYETALVGTLGTIPALALVGAHGGEA